MSIFIATSFLISKNWKQPDRLSVCEHMSRQGHIHSWTAVQQEEERNCWSHHAMDGLFALCWAREGFPGGSDSKESACNIGDPRSIPGSKKIPWEGNGNPLQYSCFKNPIDRGIWWAAVHGVTKSQTRLRWLSTHTCVFALQSKFS